MSAEAQHRHDAPHFEDFAEDWDDPEHLTPVFPDGFSAPCERCDGPSLGGRWCPSCEADLEAREP